MLKVTKIEDVNRVLDERTNLNNNNYVQNRFFEKVDITGLNDDLLEFDVENATLDETRKFLGTLAMILRGV